MLILKRVVQAALRPERRVRQLPTYRYIFQLPVVFDLTSTILQIRDLRRVGRISRPTSAAASEHHREVQAYNAGVTQRKLITRTRRAELFYEILSLPPRDLSAEKLLIVGPRNIQELFIAWTRGFNWNNMTGIDLYSTNPKILEMNMEAMTFPDATFDAVAMANTLSYANDTKRAISEVARVLKPGGRFSFSATYDPGSSWKEDKVSAQEIRDFLGEAGMSIYYYESFDKVNSSGRTQSSHSFGARKRGAAQRLDGLTL